MSLRVHYQYQLKEATKTRMLVQAAIVLSPGLRLHWSVSNIRFCHVLSSFFFLPVFNTLLRFIVSYLVRDGNLDVVLKFE